MPATTQANRELAINTALGEDKLLIRSASISEQLGRPFRMEVDLISDDPNIAFDSIVGTNATIRLALETSKKPRFLNGFVSRFVQTEANASGGAYRATLVPWLWFLTRTADCRIFQTKSVPDIIKQVFRDHGFTEFKDSLSGTYTAWEYCVQYRETDFNFVSRLMEHEGIYYFFEHDNGKHTLVLADASSAHSSFPGYDNVPFRNARAAQNTESIASWTQEQEVQPGTYALNDFNFEKPKNSLVAQSDITTQNAQSTFAIYDYPGEYGEQSEGSDYAKIRIEELHVQHEIVHGDGNARGLAVGSTFSLTGCQRRDQNRKYLITSASYHLASDNYTAFGAGNSNEEIFTCSFTAIDATKPFRAARVTPKPLIQGPQTAIVVGPKGEEIHTDKYGRIKVQFHWDRYGKADENSSCWVRISQAAWAGKKYGALYIPRVGHEVIVEFLEGDPDLPIVTGRVYNADAMPPYDLPGEKTKTTLKSSSSKGGTGFNELRFEDKKGSEQIFIHAEKDYHDRVKNDRLEWIGSDRHLVVTKDQYEKVSGDHHQEVTGENNQKVGETLSINAGQNIQEKAGMNYGVDAGMEIHLKGGMNVVIEAGMSITLKAGGGFIVVGPAGVTISGTPVLINSGGAAGSGSGISPTPPKPAKIADDAQPGSKSAVASRTPARIKSTTISPITVALKNAAADGTPFCEQCAQGRRGTGSRRGGRLTACNMAKLLQSLLFSDVGSNTYAVIDGASCEDLLDKLDEFQPESICLYAGTLDPDVKEAAPYLVRLEPDSPFMDWLVGEGWGKHWCIFVVAAADLRTMRKHFRTILLVSDPAGRSLYFRYYDPRVIRAFLPTCEPGELRQVFGPASTLVAEGEQSTIALRWNYENGAATLQRITIDR